MRSGLLGQRGIVMGLFVLSIALAGVGLAFVAVAQSTASLAQFSQTWASTQGTVVEARFSEEKGPLVRYAYETGGKKYENERIFLTEGPYSEVAAVEGGGVRITANPPKDEPLTLTYRKGDLVAVHYNPKAPEQSALSRYVLRNMTRFLLIGIGAVLLAMFFGARSFMDVE